MIHSSGVDIIEAKRIKDLVDKHGKKFLKRIFLPGEIKYCDSRKNKYEHYAARFAAKEAVMKTLAAGIDTIGFKEIEVLRGSKGDVMIRLAGKARERSDSLGISHIHISLSHTATYAVAFAIAEIEEKKKF